MPVRLSILFLCGIVSLGADHPDDQPQRWLTGNAADVSPSHPPQGGLLLMGGGGDVDAAFRWFLTQAAGGDVVVLRSSGRDGYNDYLWKELGVPIDSVETVLIRSREQAFDPALAATLAHAEAIFIAGGDQSNYVRFWQHTPVVAALNAHVAAGKPLGGTSAGLAVMGRYVYTALHDGDLTSSLALSYPNHRYITLADDFLQLPFLARVLTDSHFSERSRLGRLIIMLRHLAPTAGENIVLGLGVDERTALCIDASGRGRVLSAAHGAVHVVTLLSFDPASLAETQAEVVILGAESSIDLVSGKIENPRAQQIVQIQNAKLQIIPSPES